MSRLSSLNVVGLLDDDLVVLVGAERLAGDRVLQVVLVQHLAQLARSSRGTDRRSARCSVVLDLLLLLVELPSSRPRSCCARRLNRCVSMTMPSTPEGTSRRVVLHVLAGPAEDRVQQLLFRRQLALATSGDTLPTRMSPGRTHVPMRTMPFSSRFDSAFGRDVGNVARELLLAQLGLADFDLELLDVDRGVGVVLDQPLADDDGVLEVVAVPRHERDQHVAAQRQLAVVAWRRRRR